MNISKPPDETLKQGRNRSWLLVKFACTESERSSSNSNSISRVRLRFEIRPFLDIDKRVLVDGNSRPTYNEKKSSKNWSAISVLKRN